MPEKVIGDVGFLVSGAAEAEVPSVTEFNGTISRRWRELGGINPNKQELRDVIH